MYNLNNASAKRLFVPFILLILLILLFKPAINKYRFYRNQNQIVVFNDTTIATGKVKFSFSLKSSSVTSAGVYRNDGTLIRTLWSGTRLAAGNYTRTWDGVDDEGLLSDAGTYNIRILSNNVTYKWEGVIGNTSDSSTGSTVHHAIKVMASMAITGHTAYYATTYNEGSESTFKFDLSNPQVKTSILNAGAAVVFAATDGTNVYWAGGDPYSKKNWFVYGTKVSDDTETDFTNGTIYKTNRGRTYKSVIDKTVKDSSVISGLAVQKRNRYLFIAHTSINEVHVLDKNTGAPVHAVKFDAPGFMGTDADDNLWIKYDRAGKAVVEKFRVNNDGSLSNLNISLNGLVNPIALAASPDNSSVLVADGGTSQQIKAYNPASGHYLWSFGSLGGYATSPDVKNDKFYFNDVRNSFSSFIAFGPDGSFWVEDTGNERVQHYNSNRSFIDRVMYIPTSYNCFVDYNDATRVFSDYLEFKIDYSKPLNPGNGSWTLIKNWGYNMAKEYDDQVQRMRGISTLGNRRTYCMLFNFSKRLWQVAELPPDGPVRMTGIIINDVNARMYGDGSIRSVSRFEAGKPTVWTKKTLTGFEGTGNPVWGKAEIMAVTQPATTNDPGYFGGGKSLLSGETTSSGVIISFDGNSYPYGSTEWHLGGVKPGGSDWLWRTARNTGNKYTGAYPADGAFDIGNGVKYAGSGAMVSGRNIIWGYHGESWKGSETNEWDHIYDDGLFIGQFGITGPEILRQEAPAMFAGNSFSAALTTDKSGNVYLYHNDESAHGGVHRWKISDLNSISEQSVPVVLNYGQHGLLAQYYDGTDFNNLRIKTTRIDPSIDFNWGNNKPLNTAITSAKDYCVSWSGFVRPFNSEKYSFYGGATGAVKLWVNGQLVLNNADNANGIPVTIDLAANKNYPIKVEYSTRQSPVRVNLSWSSKSQQRQVIPAAQLYPADLPDRSQGFDLLEGLPRGSVLGDNDHGWGRSPAVDDSTSRYLSWWTAGTNNKKYDKFTSPDLLVTFTGKNKVATVSRDIFTGKNELSWKITGLVDFEGNYFNRDVNLDITGKGGNFLELLDIKNKVVLRLFLHADNTGDNAAMYVNNKILLQTDKTSLRKIVSKVQPLSIVFANNKLTVTYASYPPVVCNLFDTDANPGLLKSLYLYFWDNGNTYGRAVDIHEMKYFF